MKVSELASSRVSECAELASSRVGECAELAGSQVGESAGRGETDTPDCSWLRSGKSYEQALLGLERKGREKRHSPLQPPIEKREGKESTTGFN